MRAAPTYLQSVFQIESAKTLHPMPHYIPQPP